MIYSISFSINSCNNIYSILKLALHKVCGYIVHL